MWYKRSMSNDDFTKLIKDNQKYAEEREKLDTAFNDNSMSQEDYDAACKKIKYLQARVVLYSDKDVRAFNDMLKTYMTENKADSVPLNYAYCGHFHGSFDNLELRNAQLENVGNANFSDCNIENAQIIGDMYSSTFNKCNLDAVSLIPQKDSNGRDIRQNILDVSFINSDMNRFDAAHETQFKACEFADCKLKGSSFMTGSYLDQKSHNSYSKLKGTKFKRCDIDSCDFSGSNLADVTFSRCNADLVRFNLHVDSAVDYRDVHLVNSDINTIELCNVNGRMTFANVQSLSDDYDKGVKLNTFTSTHLSDKCFVNLHAKDSSIYISDEYLGPTLEPTNVSSMICENSSIEYDGNTIPFNMTDKYGNKPLPVFVQCKHNGEKIDITPRFANSPDVEEEVKSETESESEMKQESKQRRQSKQKIHVNPYNNVSRDAAFHAEKTKAKYGYTDDMNADFASDNESFTKSKAYHSDTFIRKIDFSKVLAAQEKNYGNYSQRSYDDAKASKVNERYGKDVNFTFGNGRQAYEDDRFTDDGEVILDESDYTIKDVDDSRFKFNFNGPSFGNIADNIKAAVKAKSETMKSERGEKADKIDRYSDRVRKAQAKVDSLYANQRQNDGQQFD